MSIHIEIVDLSDANFDELFDWSATGKGRDVGCKFCLYWEERDHSKWPDSLAQRAEAKRRWFRDAEAEFGPCGKLAFLEGRSVGYAQFAPPTYLPNVAEYKCGPPSSDAVFVSCLFVQGQEKGRGIGSALLEAILADLSAREAQAVETFALKDSPNNPSGPLSFWLKKGFQIVREDEHFSLVRRELR